jgi:23S rRNA (adenine2503-C2)-methyltransferase
MELIGKTLFELSGLSEKLGFSHHYGQILAREMYRKKARSIMEVDELPLMFRAKLMEKYTFSLLSPLETLASIDGTKKFLFRTAGGNPFETAYMPFGKRNTLCISTQSGCRMGCSFCYTGKMGLYENLSSSYIVSQVLSVPDYQAINRIVLMGMGEPLDNSKEVFKSLEILTSQWGLAFGAANITLSTVGITPHLGQLIELRMCNIAISLHSALPSIRKEIAPAENKHPIAKTIEILKKYPVKKPLRLSFEYVVVPKANDSDEDAIAVHRLLKDLRCHVNIIPLNTSTANPESLKAARAFQRMLNNLGQATTLRASRGQDIDAACGMMAEKELKK